MAARLAPQKGFGHLCGTDQGQRLQRAIEPMANRAPDLHAYQASIRRLDRVLILDLRGKPAALGTMAVHIRRAVKKHHFVFHVTSPVDVRLRTRRGGSTGPQPLTPVSTPYLTRGRDARADTSGPASPGPACSHQAQPVPAAWHRPGVPGVPGVP